MKWSVNVGDTVFYLTEEIQYLILEMDEEGFVTRVRNINAKFETGCKILHKHWTLAGPKKSHKEQICEKIMELENRFKEKQEQKRKLNSAARQIKEALDRKNENLDAMTYYRTHRHITW